MKHLKRLLAALGGLICTHDWIFVERVHEQNLRTGLDHWSDVHRCLRCDRYETRELPPANRPFD